MSLSGALNLYKIKRNIQNIIPQVSPEEEKRQAHMYFVKTTILCFRYEVTKWNFNPYHAEFLKWNNPSYIFDTVHYQFKGYQDESLKMVSQQYRARSDCTDVQAGLALYCWQRLITFGAVRIWVNTTLLISCNLQLLLVENKLNAHLYIILNCLVESLIYNKPWWYSHMKYLHITCIISTYSVVNGNWFENQHSCQWMIFDDIFHISLISHNVNTVWYARFAIGVARQPFVSYAMDAWRRWLVTVETFVHTVLFTPSMWIRTRDYVAVFEEYIITYVNCICLKNIMNMHKRNRWITFTTMFKVYTGISHKILHKWSHNLWKCLLKINIHLTVNPFTFNKHCKIVYIIVHNCNTQRE